MHTEVFKNIDLLIEMAGSKFNQDDIESDLIQVNKDIQDKKQRLEDLKSIMNDTRYFNASSELVDKNIEVSLKSKITRLNRKIKTLELDKESVKRNEKDSYLELESLKKQIDDTKKYLDVLHSTSLDDKDYQTIIKHEEEYLTKLNQTLEEKNKLYEDVLSKSNLLEQALRENEDKLENYTERLKEVSDNLSNPNAYIDEDLKKQDEQELSALNDALDELQNRKLSYLTDPHMIGADAKELVAASNYTEALSKVKELLEVVKAKPYMDVTDLSVLDEELEKKEQKRAQLASYIDSKDYKTAKKEIVLDRLSFLDEQIKNYNDIDEAYKNLIDKAKTVLIENLSKMIKSLEEELETLLKQMSEYQVMLDDKTKSRRVRANIENAILKKKREQEVIMLVLENCKKDLLFQIKMIQTNEKIIAKYQAYLEQKKIEKNELEHMKDVDSSSKDYIEEEKDKAELKALNDEIKEIENRKKYNKMPDEIYDEIEMLLANMEPVKKEEALKEEDLSFDEILDDDGLIKVVDVIPAHTITTSGGVHYGD